jgi:outer membrane protein assembly factor BamB
MIKFLPKTILICALVSFMGCVGGGIPRWRQFHGDLASGGYLPVESGFALSAAWTVGPYKITSSSPVIGYDIDGNEVIYVGTIDAQLVALNSVDGSEKWRRSFASADKILGIASSPAVSRKGDIYVVTNHRINQDPIQSTLHKVDEFSNLRWSYIFPDSGFTLGSPKILKWGEDTLIFIYVTVVMSGDLQGELFVLRDRGKHAELLDRKALGGCQWDREGRDTRIGAAFDSFAAVWSFISTFPVDFDEDGIGLPDMFVEPTVAVFSDRKIPLIAIADNLCSIGAYELDDEGLSVVWRVKHEFDKHSSPVLMSNGLMVFGRQDGKVLAYDAETGAKLWEYDAGQAVFSTPAAKGERYIFVVSKSHIQVLTPENGSLLYDETSPRKLEFAGQTYASPVVTENCVYVAAREIITLSHDFSKRSQDTNFRGNGLSSIAVANNGAIYAVALDGTIRKYQGTK